MMRECSFPCTCRACRGKRNLKGPCPGMHPGQSKRSPTDTRRGLAPCRLPLPPPTRVVGPGGEEVGGAAQRAQRVCQQQVGPQRDGLVQQHLLQAEHRLLVQLGLGRGRKEA